MPHLTTQHISATEDFGQGDIIVRNPNHSKLLEAYLIITADCDIAHQKAGKNFTALPLRTISDYVNFYWAPAQLAKIENELCNEIINEVNEKIDGLNGSKFNHDNLVEFIKEHGCEPMIAPSDLSCSTKESLKKLEEILLKQNANDKLSYLDILFQSWNILNKNEKYQKNQIKSSLSRKSIPNDIHIIVNIPDFRYDLGYFVDLRDVKAIPIMSCYKDLSDLKIYGDGLSYYRYCRLSDSLKYLIVQKFANLYSRIGLNAQWESEHDILSELFSEHLLDQKKN